MTKKRMSTARLDVTIPADLYQRLEYVARLPAHHAHGGTLEGLVVRALDAGLIGIAVAYERFEGKKPITDALAAEAFGRARKKRLAAGTKGSR